MGRQTVLLNIARNLQRKSYQKDGSFLINDLAEWIDSAVASINATSHEIMNAIGEFDNIRFSEKVYLIETDMEVTGRGKPRIVTGYKLVGEPVRGYLPSDKSFRKSEAKRIVRELGCRFEVVSMNEYIRIKSWS